MNWQRILVILSGIAIGSYAHADDIFNQVLGKEVEDPTIVTVENKIKHLTKILKDAQENNQENLVNTYETTLKVLFKERAHRIKELEKRGFAPKVNKSLYTSVEWRVKQPNQDDN